MCFFPRNLTKMIKTHSSVIKRHRALGMASLEHLQLLLEVSITPDELLSLLSKWQSFYKFDVSIDQV